MNIWIRRSLGLTLGVAFSGAVLVMGAWQAFKAAPGEWTYPVQIGRWHGDLSVPAMLHVATHPFTMRLLEGRSLKTRFGPVHWQAGAAPGSWQAVCAPCSVKLPQLGVEPLRLARAEFSVMPDAEMKLQGDFKLIGAQSNQGHQGNDGIAGVQAGPVEGHWRSRIERDHARLSFSVNDQALAKAFGLFATQIPELGRAQIDGRFSIDAELTLPAREFSMKPHIEGFRVAGLGTEALLHAEAGCAANIEPGDGDSAGADPVVDASHAELPFGIWLPRAVIAAEDQRFYEHSGFDLTEIASAWAMNSSAASDAGALHGGSTLPQQLAKLLYTGDARTPGRKLRELLYAVELDRTLGKARLLNLYLSIAPWGDGRCGAAAASRHFLHKAPAELTPMEAVWLATLLHNPDRELAQMSRDGQANNARVRWVADQLRPAPMGRRAAWRTTASHWTPPPQAFTSAMAVAASRAALGQ